MRVPRPRRLPADSWRWATDHLPIACVDVLPVARDADGAVTHVGLIRRDSPWGEVWCHVGGRQERLESVHDAARRTLDESLSPVDDVVPSPEPFLVQEYFPDVRPGAGVDPRKHAVAVCFTADVPAGRALRARGSEARGFAWFEVGALPEPSTLWPGSLRMVQRAVAPAPDTSGTSGTADELAAYESLSAREVSLNELMWQTPALAMTAMAFLLTIALGDGAAWQRALAGALSAVVAVASAQLLAKHSAGAIADADALHALETRRGMLPVHAPPKRGPRATVRGDGLWAWFADRRSRRWWFVSLLAFGAVSALLTVTATAEALGALV
ncbi:DUF4916 domain-containing protein [Cellulomonas sp. B6]|uniref:DUF4916 domain-containing protein n=1 Tax=Cellulomonas sp. B6 TaxID=1295626 RepID=UPI00073C336E|nr:DUF4916 domain-containing protein [Cellulomonas sp. B6]KSW29823.1 hypothetical protein ATM99_06110 [Cellulomonas sp. B6]